MLIGNLPEDTTPSAAGYVPYSEDGIHLSKISRDNLLKGAGHGTGMIFWDEGDGQIVNDGTHTNVPRTVTGSLYSYEVEEDGKAYWFAMYPASYWSGDITTNTRHVWELAYEEGGEIHYVAYMDNDGKIFINNYTTDNVYSTRYVYEDDEGNEINLLDYFMQKFQAGEGIYYDGTTFRGIGATEIVINGMIFTPDENGNFNIDFGNEFIYSNVLGMTLGLKLAGTQAPSGSYENGDDYFVPLKSLFMMTSDGKACPLTDQYASSTSVQKQFNPDQLFYYDKNEDSILEEVLYSEYVFQSHKQVPINDMYGLSLSDGELYLVGTFTNSGWFVLDSNFLARSLPSTEDGKIYIYLGYVVSGKLDFQLNRPKYCYLDGGVRPYSYQNTVIPPISDVKFKQYSSSTPVSIVGDNGEVTFMAGSNVDLSVFSRSDTGAKGLYIDVNATGKLDTIPYSGESNGFYQAGQTSLTTLGMLSPTYTYDIDITVILKYSNGNSFTPGKKYTMYLAFVTDLTTMLPYDNNKGGYFKDVQISDSSTELVFHMHGIFKGPSYGVQVPPALVAQLDNAESDALKATYIADIVILDKGTT